jgi:hypothetical protein
MTCSERKRNDASFASCFSNTVLGCSYFELSRIEVMRQEKPHVPMALYSSNPNLHQRIGLSTPEQFECTLELVMTAIVVRV